MPVIAFLVESPLSQRDYEKFIAHWSIGSR